MPASQVPSLGDQIRTERTRKGVSLRALARDVGVSASMISQIETGKSRPSVSTLYAITTALGMSLQEIFDLVGTAGEAVPDGEAAPTAAALADGAGVTGAADGIEGASPAG